MQTEISTNNAWVESYLNALLNFGLSSEYAGAAKETGPAPDADRELYSRYYVQSLLKLDEENLKFAWSRAASATKSGGDKDARLQYLSWRIWHLKRKHAEVERDRRLYVEANETLPEVPPSRDYSSDEEGGEARGVSSPVRGGVLPFVQPSDLAPVPNNLRPLSVKVQQHQHHQQQQQSDSNAAAAAGLGPTAPAAATAIDALFEDLILSSHEATPMLAPVLEPPRLDRLYIVMISLHGLVRGDSMELGRDSDTGGQVKYVVELARAMALHPAVFRVDLLTRLIRDPTVDADYGKEEECLAKGRGELGGAYIVRLPCGPVDKYIHKEELWPHVREFADNGLAHVSKTLRSLSETGRRCELYCVHGHYADAGEAAVLMCCTLGAPMAMTGHSLGRNKLEHLLGSGTMTRAEIEATYAISRRIEAEERCLDVATMVYTSTQQEIEEQWGLYDGYNPALARVLRFRRSFGRAMPFMKVSPPGLDFSNLKVSMPQDPVLKEFEEQRVALEKVEFAPLSTSVPPSPLGGAATSRKGSSTPDAAFKPSRVVALMGQSPPSVSSPVADSPQAPPPPPPRADIIPHGPPIWQEIARFLRNPLKPAILAMSRPDTKKNITTLVKAFGEHTMLRELANLVLVMGNRDNIDSMAASSQKVLTQVLKLVDAHDLYGSVAYPKHHTQTDISDIYLFARETRGVFVNIALQEPFGLTVIEAAAHGVPTVATCNGGPVDIMATLHHGVVVDPTDSDAVAAALLNILTAPSTWSTMSICGVDNIMAYSWPAHCKRYMEAMDLERRFVRGLFNRKPERGAGGLLERRLSRLDLLGIVDADVSAPLGSPSHAAMDIQRQFSTPAYTPGDMTPVAMLSGGANSPVVMRRPSGLTTDDLDVLQSLHTESLARKIGPEVAKSRRAFVVVPLDSDKVVGRVMGVLTQLLDSLTTAGLTDSVGVGVLSMLGFDSTHESLHAAGIEPSAIDFAVCNSGADVWLRHESGRWEADDNYESRIDFHWDRISLHRMLKKIVSAPVEDHRRLPRLKELLYTVAEAPEAGVHPRHICMELDPETQGILAAGMGPKARTAGGVRLAAAVSERLKRRLRTKGFRASYTLQFVPQEEGAENKHLAVMHITPLRATRPLALRAVMERIGLPMEAVIMVVMPPEMRNGEGLATAVLGPATSDMHDMVAGAQRVLVVRPQGDASTMYSGDLAADLGTPLAPYRDMTRVELVESEAAGEALVAGLRNIKENGSL